MPSLIQSAIVFALFAGMAAFVWAMRRHFCRRYDVTEARVARMASIVLGAGLLMALVVFLLGRLLNSPILFATEVEGTGALQTGDPGIVRTVRFPITHAGDQLFLVVRPVADRAKPATHPARIRYRFVRPDEKVVFNAELKFIPEQDRKRPSAPPAWGEVRLPFTPDTTGTYTVRLFPQSPGIASIHVRVEDPGRQAGILGRWRR